MECKTVSLCGMIIKKNLFGINRLVILLKILSMKIKSILFAVISASIICALIISFNVSIDDYRNTNELFDANVEVLARTEIGGFGPMCSQTGVSGTYRMKLCSNCNGTFGDYAMDSVAYCQGR